MATKAAPSPFAGIISTINQMVQQGRQKVNENLAKLAPLEQSEAARECIWLFQSAKCVMDDLNRVFERLDQIPGTIDEAMSAAQEAAKLDPEVVSAIKAKLIQEGVILEKTTVDGLLEQAETKGENKAKEVFAQEKKTAILVEERRGKLATALAEKLKPKNAKDAAAWSVELAAKFPSEKLADDAKFESNITVAATRIEQSLAAGVTGKETLAGSVMMDDNAFSVALGSWKEFQSRAPQRAGTAAHLATPAAGAARQEAATEKGKPSAMLI